MITAPPQISNGCGKSRRMTIPSTSTIVINHCCPLQQHVTRRNRTTTITTTSFLSIGASMRWFVLLCLFGIAQIPNMTSSFPNGYRKSPKKFGRIISLPSSTDSSWNENVITATSDIIGINATTTMTPSRTMSSSSSSGTGIDIELEEQINQGLQRAKEVLQKSKAKLAAMQQNTAASSSSYNNNNSNNGVVVPFFATRLTATATTAVATATVSDAATLTTVRTSNNDHLKVKSRNSDTGLVMADGERMAELSEQEPWEYRSIYEIFSSSSNSNDDYENPTSRVEIQTDVMASIQNLRKVLQTEDYRKIFDPRNRFIGEDN